MIIRHMDGDLLHLFAQGTHFTTIAHGCNCNGIMGAGIAKQISTLYPVVYAADIIRYNHFQTEIFRRTGRINDIKRLSLQAGTIDPVTFVVRNDQSILSERTVINAYTQFNPGRAIVGSENRLDLIESCFKEINKYMKVDNNPRPVLGIPKIGAGLAGGNWDQICEVIHHATPDIDVIVINYRQQHD